MLYDVEVLGATNNWWVERQSKGAHHYIIRIIPFLFDVLNSLYTETRKLPLRQKISGAHQKQVDQHYLITIGFFLPPQDYSTLRLILSLVGDIYNLLTPLRRVDQVELMELSPYVNSLYIEADRFREIRNCFTHLDEVFTDMDKHGITGEQRQIRH